MHYRPWAKPANAAGIVRLSMPGFSSDGRRALVYAETDGEHEGITGRLFYLEADERGSWTVRWGLIQVPDGC
jgi:hypothetical protein